jgi:hypothetical protein
MDRDPGVKILRQYEQNELGHSEISCSQGGEYEGGCLLTVEGGHSLVEVRRRFRGACCFYHCRLVDGGSKYL